MVIVSEGRAVSYNMRKRGTRSNRLVGQGLRVQAMQCSLRNEALFLSGIENISEVSK